MNIIYLTTEAVPFAKTGGLADVCGTLPSVVAAAGHQCAVIMPAFESIYRSGMPIETTDMSFAIPTSHGRLIGGRLLRSHLPGGQVPVYFIDQPQFYGRPSLYGDSHGDYHDNAERFAFYCLAAIETIKRLEWRADLIHCNDWQSAIVPALIQSQLHREKPSSAASPRDSVSAGRAASWMANVPSILSIHNLAYQGSYPADTFPSTGLSWEHFRSDSFEYFGRFNFLKTGIVTADQVCTVSPTYAREIMTPLHGCGLDGILSAMSDRVSGIINGIDTEIWNPATDPHLFENYDLESWQAGKTANKLGLQNELGLPQNPEIPLIGLVGRLADQKGWDLILPVLKLHLQQRRPTQWAVLGSGDPSIERSLETLSEQYPNQLGTYLGFSDTLAHRIEAASDLFVMPSRYEPCGLNQLYSLRYGTACVVTKTGGLTDTIVDADATSLAHGTATGFHLADYSAASLDARIGQALQLRYHEPSDWKKIIETGMSQDWSWRRSAAQYIALYARTISLRRRA